MKNAKTISRPPSRDFIQNFTQTDKLHRQTLNIFEINNDLIDCFRNLYTKHRLYTFSQTGGKSKSRIDRLYLSSNLIGKIQKVNFESTKLTDHKIIRNQIANQIEKGPGVWIFNNNHLKNTDFTEKMSPLLKQYTESQETIGYPDNRTTWEFMKMEARNYTKKN